MAKLAPTSIKYIIKAKIKAKGVVEKPDIIGAVFGQTEGLLGSELDLRELQRTGRIGRIEVNITSKEGKSEGEIIIPSALDSAETSLIAATLETIERVGPCEAEIKLEGVEDTRSEKRKYVIDKAKDILKQLMESGGESDEISEGIKEAVRTDEITSYKGLPAGPDMMESDTIIIVEGRADILNLLKYGIKNTVAVGGTGNSEKIVELANEKNTTVFVDGDRGGKLIVKELMQKADIDFVATAPTGKEVEELSQKEAYKALREKVSAEQFRSKEKMGPARPGPARPRPASTGTSPSSKPAERRGERSEQRSEQRPGQRTGLRSEERTGQRFGQRDRDRMGPGKRFERSKRFERRPGSRLGSGPRMPRMEPREQLSSRERELFKKTLKELVGSRAACIFDANCEMLGKVPVPELLSTLRTIERPYAVVLDGRVDFRLGSVARAQGVRFLIAKEKDSFSSPVTVLEKKEL